MEITFPCIFYVKPKNQGFLFSQLLPRWDEPLFVGVDWAAGSGMNRGEIFKRNGNVIYVRFKTVEMVPRETIS